MFSETEITKTLEPSPRQQRILKWMEGGNCIFEVIGKTYSPCTTTTLTATTASGKKK